MRIVLDTNVLISALIRAGFIRNFIFHRIDFEFLTPAYTLSEIGKYKQEIYGKAGISEEEFCTLLELLFSHVKIVNPSYYSFYIPKAEEIMSNIHKEDAVFIAAALAFNCPIWSDDKHFKKQEQVKIFTTKEITILMS